jgi:hypothetical protein
MAQKMSLPISEVKLIFLYPLQFEWSPKRRLIIGMQCLPLNLS